MQFFNFLSPFRFLLLQAKPLQLIYIPPGSMFLIVAHMQYHTAYSEYTVEVRSDK